MVATTSDADRNASFLPIIFGRHGECEGSCRDRVGSMARRSPRQEGNSYSPWRQDLAKVCAYIASRAEPSLFPAQRLNVLGSP